MSRNRSKYTDAVSYSGSSLLPGRSRNAACARALRAHPQLNATFRDDALELHADANIGVGTALGNEGLIVPVLHRAQELNLFGVALRLGQLVAGARAGKLAPSSTCSRDSTVHGPAISEKCGPPIGRPAM